MPFPLWDERDSDSDGWVTAAPALFRFNPREAVKVKPAPDEPRDCMVELSRAPGVEGLPYTRKEAQIVATAFGGRVRPWDCKYKTLGTYPHPGQRPSGKPAKYGKELQNGKDEE